MCQRTFQSFPYKPTKYCAECAHLAFNAVRASVEQKRRARKKTVEAEYVETMKVFQRDQWRCQLCGCKTPKALRGKDKPNSPELDHIVPLSRGGAHTYANTQCACAQCNQRKGSKILGQTNFNL